MKLLLDTNVILDVFFERAKFQDYAKQIFCLIEQKYCRGCVSSTAITDIYYMARKQFHDSEKAFEVISNLAKLFKIVKTDDKTVKKALELHWPDFE
ncbi:MAG: PIN domain-containing protein, partial [Spirochaetales bacterium]|nr:PIN domain-containing protein [Spirochaetales bacterium]